MKIFITLDYELFMGRKTGTPQKCLIDSMAKLSEVANKYGVRYVIFVDAAYLLRMKELSLNNKLNGDYKLVVNHIRHLSELGHDIEMHFHPQWLFSSFDGFSDSWDMDLKHYKLSDLPKDFAFSSFREAKNLLDEIIGRKTIAFRAGGYSLNSFNTYSELLKVNDIKIDSSVCSRSSVRSRFQEYDYRKTPLKSSYKFHFDISVECKNGDLIEMPITNSKKMCSIHYLMRKRCLVREFGRDVAIGDGIGIGKYLSKVERCKGLLCKLFSWNSFHASIDGMMSINLYPMYQQKRAENVKEMVIIGHPKSLTNKSLEILETFIQKVIHEADFCTFKDDIDYE